MSRRILYAHQCSQNVDVNGPHHRCFELILSSSFNQPMAVERGRSHELVGSMMGAVYVHVLRTLMPTENFPRHFGTIEMTHDALKIVFRKFNFETYCFVTNLMVHRSPSYGKLYLLLFLRKNIENWILWKRKFNNNNIFTSTDTQGQSS